MTHRIEDAGRRDLNFSQAKVKDILPEYFLSDYPDLVKFLEAYHQFLDSDGDQSFVTEINSLYAARDINQTSLANLDQLIREIGNGLQSASFFQNPRLMAKLLAEFYRAKGSVVSAEGFFRAFYNQEATIEYPKRNVLTINDADNNFLDHHIGYESLKFIQDNRRYQTFSILIKTGLSTSEYETLYKKFVHPAGFYFEGEVLLEGIGNLDDSAFTGVDSDEIRGVSAVGPKLVQEVTLGTATPFTQLTGLIDSAGTDFRVGVDQLVNIYQDFTAAELNGFYDNVAQLISPNSFTFDDSEGVSPDTTLTVETMDNTIFTRYTSDSSY